MWRWTSCKVHVASSLRKGSVDWDAHNESFRGKDRKVTRLLTAPTPILLGDLQKDGCGSSSVFNIPGSPNGLLWVQGPPCLPQWIFSFLIFFIHSCCNLFLEGSGANCATGTVYSWIQCSLSPVPSGVYSNTHQMVKALCFERQAVAHVLSIILFQRWWRVCQRFALAFYSSLQIGGNFTFLFFKV